MLTKQAAVRKSSSRGFLKRNAEDELIVKKFIQIGLARDGQSDYYELTQGGTR